MPYLHNKAGAYESLLSRAGSYRDKGFSVVVNSCRFLRAHRNREVNVNKFVNKPFSSLAMTSKF